MLSRFHSLSCSHAHPVALCSSFSVHYSDLFSSIRFCLLPLNSTLGITTFLRNQCTILALSFLSLNHSSSYILARMLYPTRSFSFRSVFHSLPVPLNLSLPLILIFSFSHPATYILLCSFFIPLSPSLTLTFALSFLSLSTLFSHILSLFHSFCFWLSVSVSLILYPHFHSVNHSTSLILTLAHSLFPAHSLFNPPNNFSQCLLQSDKPIIPRNLEKLNIFHRFLFNDIKHSGTHTFTSTFGCLNK